MNFLNLLVYFINLLSCLSATASSSTKNSPSHVKDLTDANFSQLTGGKASGKWVIKLYTTFCSACNQLKPIFEQLATEVSELDNSINFGQINIEDNNAISLKFFITRVPTMYLINNGKAYNITEIPRRLPDLKKYLIEKEYINQNPIKGLFNPYGIVGITFFYLGKMVNKLKSLSKVAPNWILLSIPSILIFIGFYFIFKPPQSLDRSRPITIPNPTSASNKKSKKRK